MSESTGKKGRQTPWDDSVDPEPGEFGAWLRRERELREVTLAEIAEVTKISKSYLEALEEERFDVLPAPLFAKGFLREYARYVGLDPDAVVNSYLTARREGEPEETSEAGRSERLGGFQWTSGVLMAAGLVVLLAVIGFVGFWAERSNKSGDGESSADSVSEAPPVADPMTPAQPVTEPSSGATSDPASASSASQGSTISPDSGPQADPAADSATPSAPLVVTIDFTEDCWVEAAVDGRRRLSELHVQGESLQIDAQRWVELTLGNPTGVRVEVNGEPYQLPEFRPGRVARDIRIEVETLDPDGSGE